MNPETESDWMFRQLESLHHELSAISPTFRHMAEGEVVTVTAEQYVREGWAGRPDVLAVFYEEPDQPEPRIVIGVIDGYPITKTSIFPLCIVYRVHNWAKKGQRPVRPDAPLTVVLKGAASWR